MRCAAGVILVIPLLMAGCSDPTAVQKFAQSAPPASDFHTLLVGYDALPMQLAVLDKITLAGVASKNLPIELAAARTETERRCGQVATLDRLHAAMTGYMTALGNLATAGTTSGSSMPPAVAGTAPSPATAPTAIGAAGGPSACPPMPFAAASAAGASPTAMSATAVSPAAAPGPAGAHAAAAPAAPAAGGTSLTTSLQALAKEYKFSQADATAAGGLVTLAVDAATLWLREQALRTALGQPYQDGFLAAIRIERSVIQWNLVGVGGSPTDLDTYQNNLAAELSNLDGLVAKHDPQDASLPTTLLLLATLRGEIMSPKETIILRNAATAYLAALDGLQKAYTTLTDTAAKGDRVLTQAMWTKLQQPLTDVANAYAALSKL
jgi:hypothetical protein